MPKRKNGIEWSGMPEELGYSSPYAVAILSRHVEIRNIETRALVQSAEMPHARLLTQGKLLYIASTSEVWRLIPYSFPQQVTTAVFLSMVVVVINIVFMLILIVVKCFCA